MIFALADHHEDWLLLPHWQSPWGCRAAVAEVLPIDRRHSENPNTT
jgi:hypothetical protein